MTKRFTSNSIKHDQLKKLRALREDFARMAADKAYKDRVRAAWEKDAWAEYKATVRPLQGRLF